MVFYLKRLCKASEEQDDVKHMVVGDQWTAEVSNVIQQGSWYNQPCGLTIEGVDIDELSVEEGLKILRANGCITKSGDEEWIGIPIGSEALSVDCSCASGPTYTFRLPNGKIATSFGDVADDSIKPSFWPEDEDDDF